MLVSLAQRMLVSGRGLDSWIKIKQNKTKKKKKESLRQTLAEAPDWFWVYFLVSHAVARPAVFPLWAQMIESPMMQQPSLCSEVIKVTLPRARARVWRRFNRKRAKAKKGTTITQTVCGSQPLALSSPFLQPRLPPPHPHPHQPPHQHTNGFNRRSAWLGCGHTSNPEEW